MKHFKLKLAVALIGALGLAAAPALTYARDGSSSSSGDTQASSQTNNDSSGDSSTTTAQESTHQVSPAEQEAEQQETAKAETDGHKFLTDLEAKHGKHTEEQRKKNCQAAEKGLEPKLVNIQKNAARFKSKIDEAYQKALVRQSADNLNPAGIDQLEATANADKATAATSVAALSGLSVNLDCKSTTVAENVATFRSAAKQARTDLMAYKNAVKAVLTALEGAAQNG